jgi:predicted enzyme related to lactoylglutathione lyase
MNISLGRSVILVEDYDNALEFYTKVFDCFIIFDQKARNGKRILHIGFDPKEKAGVWFIKAEDEDQLNSVGNQTTGKPALVFYTDSFDKFYQKLKQLNVKIVNEPSRSSELKLLQFLDLYGNIIVVIEIK